MALRTNVPFKDAVVNEIITLLAGTTGTAGSAHLYIYTGTQPTTAGGTASGTLLCDIGPINWAASTAGTGALSTSFVGTACETGTAGWARCALGTAVTSYMVDGAVATSGQTFTIDGLNIASGAEVTLSAANIYQG